MNSRARKFHLRGTLRPHGERAKYMEGCRCMLCRAANSRYSTMREKARRMGDTRELVPADDVRAHMSWLSKRGVGYKAVAEAAGVGKTTVFEILTGRANQLHAHRARAILAVTPAAAADRALVDAAAAKRMLEHLMREGFTKTELARRLGSKAKTPALQFFSRRMTARNVMKVEKLYRQIFAGEVWAKRDAFDRGAFHRRAA